MEPNPRWLVVLGAAVVLLGPTPSAGASAGSIDQSFASQGARQSNLSGLDFPLDLLMQPDGKTVTIGYTAVDRGVLVRNLDDGNLDPDFGAAGVVRTAPQSFLEAGVLQGDGRIVVVGSTGADDIGLFRYLPSGAPDSTFGGDGFVQTDLGSTDDAYAVAAQPNGRLVVAGRSGDALAVLRYLPDGTLDPAFGTGGRTTTVFAPGTSWTASSVGILSTGAIVVGGRGGPSQTGEVGPLLARYTSGGNLDTGFGAGGRVAAADGRMASVASLVVQSGDRVVVAGTAGEEMAQVARLARYRTDGSLDATFGAAGFTETRLGATYSVQDLIVDGAGRLLATGLSADANPGMEPGPFAFLVVSRLSADGVADASFGCAGSTQVELLAEEGGSGSSVAVAPDGRIVVAGTAFNDPTTDTGPDIVVVRLLADGPATAAYWVTRSDGGISPFGSAGGCGSLRGLTLNGAIVGQANRASGDGYWLVADDGGVFSRGDAPFLGSAGGIALDRPVVGMAATPTGNGYWLVASDGGIFAYGDARFHGSTGGIALDRPVVGMAATPTGDGYWLVASDGGIFTFGDAPFHGSMAEFELRYSVIGMKATSDGAGYWLADMLGGVFAFGDAPVLGSTAGPFQAPAVGIT